MATGKGHGEMETGKAGEGEKEKKWRWGDRGWRGGAIEGTKIGRLMLFYNTGAGDREWRGDGKEVRIGTHGMGRENQGGGQGLVG